MTLDESQDEKRKSSPQKINVALFLINRQFIRSWIESGLIGKLEATGGVKFTIFAQTDVYEKLSEETKKISVSIGSLTPSRYSRHMVAMGLVQFAQKSSTFRFRIERQFLPETWFVPKGQGIRQSVLWFFKSLKRTLRSSVQNRWTILYMIKPIRGLMTFYLSKSDSANSLPNEIRHRGFDWLILPTASAHGLITDFLRASRNHGLKTLVAIDNWDQLTGKSTFPDKPDYFTVMGRRCVQHAIDLHECHPQSVLPFGLPRFDVYRQIQHSCAPKAQPKRVVLYCGVALAHSEKHVVDQIADAFADEIRDGEVEIRYRPHPGPLMRYDNYELKNTSIKSTVYGDITQTAMPRMDQEFIDTIFEADIVVGAPTTLILEALICKRKVVLDLTTDNFHRTTAGNSAKKHTHIRDLTDVSTIPRGYSIQELISELKIALDDPSNCAHHETAHLYNPAEPPYSSQLFNFLCSHTDT